MKCDTDPLACQPCRQKNLRCFTTDRVTGRPRERGQSDRAENEVMYLRDQLLAYQTKYGPLQPEDMTQLPPRPPPDQPTPRISSTYVGWPPPDNTEALHKGPVNGTKVDILDGVVDVCDFPCELMEPPARGEMGVFNLSRTSIINTIFGFQRITDPPLPSKEDALREIDHFLVIMSQYVPVVHRPSLKEQVFRSTFLAILLLLILSRRFVYMSNLTPSLSPNESRSLSSLVSSPTNKACETM